MWALPVLLASLVFWPLWLFALVAGAAGALAGDDRPRRADGGRAKMRLPGKSSRKAEETVAWIASRKYGFLAISAAGIAGLLIFVLVFLTFMGSLDELDSAVVHAEGYAAVAGLVLGLPALLFAMVTDNSVESFRNELGMEGKLEELSGALGTRLKGFEKGLPGHVVQVFLPNLTMTRLRAVHDPKHESPGGGWGIDRRAPQALTGSAWVGRTYLWASGDKLKQAKLRLTEDQLERFAKQWAVAAAPILGRGIDPLGVLTIATKSEDTEIGTPSFEQRHTDVAASLAPLIGDYVLEKTGPLSQEDLSGHR